MNKYRIIFILLTRTGIPPHRRNSRIRTGLLTAFVKPCTKIGKRINRVSASISSLLANYNKSIKIQTFLGKSLAAATNM